MFTMIPEMSFGRRLSLWWSCIWRQTLATLPIWLVAGGFVLYSIVRAEHGEANWLSSLVNSMGALVLVGGGVLLVVSLLCIPIIGYMTRRAFARHQLIVPPDYSFGQAAMLGLTTWGWTIVVSMAVNVLSYLLQAVVGKASVVMAVGQLVFLVLNMIGAIYIVLPRQAWRLRRQAGEPEAR
ncbi:hypothetical protein [Burkholderia gladioli]|uniref:hypothetical protein n=1 Tax=Burkholderia gladioli TaxID=28095 RepID=UPI0016412DB0|nr:hypothetical protein [Burkholderia gladioli]